MEAHGPAFPIGGPTATSWREHALSRVRELRGVNQWMENVSDGLPAIRTAVENVNDHLNAAEEAALGRQSWWKKPKAAMAGASVERAMTNLDAAEAELLRYTPEAYVRGQLQNLVAHVRGHIAKGDPRRVRIEDIAERDPQVELSPVDREAVVAGVRIASLESRREIIRVRSFRNVLYVTALFLTLALAGLIVLGVAKPDAVPLCFNPEEEVVCPTSVEQVGTSTDQPPQAEVDPVVRSVASSWDIPVVALVGVIAAAVAAAASLRDVKGTSTPFSLPIALAVLKLPTGGLTAFLGLQLMRGEFVPGLSALDSPAQIVAWAILFGYAQQLLTQFVDRQAQGVLDDVGKPDRPPATEAATGAAAVQT